MNITKVTNVYETVVINKTTVNNITYVNQRVNGGVTVVSHDAFVNARPVGRNVVAVPPRELAAAPVSHTFERTSCVWMREKWLPPRSRTLWPRSRYGRVSSERDVRLR